MSRFRWFANKTVPRREFLETAIKKSGVTVLPLVFTPGIVMLSGGTTQKVPHQGRLVGTYSFPNGGEGGAPIFERRKTIGPLTQPGFNIAEEQGTVEWKSGHPPKALSTGPVAREQTTAAFGTGGPREDWIGPNAKKLCEQSVAAANAATIARAKVAGVDTNSFGFLANSILRCFTPYP